MSPSHVEIGMRNIGTESRASDPNRQGVLHPRLRRVAFLDGKASDPLDRARSAEHCRQQIAYSEVFNLALTLDRLNLRSLQETLRDRVRPSRGDPSQDRGRQ